MPGDSCRHGEPREGPAALRSAQLTAFAHFRRERRPESRTTAGRVPLHRVSKETMKVVVFHRRRARANAPVSHLCYTSHVSSQSQTRVKLNRVFFPR